VILAEVVRQFHALQRKAEPIHPAEIVTRVRRAVSEGHGLRAHDVVLLKPGGIPRTSSGKIQRHLCRSGYLAQSLAQVEV